MSFKSKKTFQERVSESYSIMKKYPDKVPIICENYDKSLPKLDRSKYLVPFWPTDSALATSHLLLSPPDN